MTSVFRYELKIRKQVYKSLKKQHAFLVENGEELYNSIFLRYFTTYKTLNGVEKWFSRLEEFWEQMGIYDMIDKMKTDIQKVFQIGYKVNYRKHKDSLTPYNVDFELNNPAVAEYIRKFEDLHLSNYKGSISFTTKNNVIAELRKWVEQNLSYTEVAKNIQVLDQSLFSLNRAKLIATNETGKAYEFGNYVPMKEAANQGATVEKQRSTVHDNRVTAQCKANENEWWIPLKQVWGSGDDLPPRERNPRCRCTCLYQIN